MDFFTTLLLATGAILLLQYLWRSATKGFDLFERQGIPFLKPVPFFGSQAPVLLGKVGFTEFLTAASRKFPGAPITGLFSQKVPVYLINDPDLIKQMGVKDFDYFIDRRSITDAETDPLFGNVLINMKSQKWKDMRATLSPVFTGSKMRQMFDLLSEMGGQIGAYFKGVPETERVVEMKDVFARIAVDVIATTNFGVKIDSLKDKENDFFRQVNDLLNFKNPLTVLRLIFLALFTPLAKAISLRLIPQSKTRFIVDLVRETERTRETQNIVRPDLIHFLMQLKKGQLKHEETSEDFGFATAQDADLGRVEKRAWTDDELMAQAFTFFFAGFETVSSAGSFIAYELAVNPEVQRRLISEVDAINEELQGRNLTYEALQKMKYLDMVVSEGLRYWPLTDMIDRLCVRDYNLRLPDGRTIKIEKGSNLWFPISALHFDEKHYENPTKFDPERFSDENRHRINSGAYMPFGIGPRNCIGSRFALMELKAVLYYFLRDFSFEVTEKTEIPLKMKKLFRTPENGIWLKMEPRGK